MGFFYKELILFHNVFYSFHIQKRYLSPNSELLNLSWLCLTPGCHVFMEGCDSINFSFLFLKSHFFLFLKKDLGFFKKLPFFFKSVKYYSNGVNNKIFKNSMFVDIFIKND